MELNEIKDTYKRRLDIANAFYKEKTGKDLNDYQLKILAIAFEEINNMFDKNKESEGDYGALRKGAFSAINIILPEIWAADTNNYIHLDSQNIPITVRKYSAFNTLFDRQADLDNGIIDCVFKSPINNNEFIGIKIEKN